jgi:CIC family chloride channel protein
MAEPVLPPLPEPARRAAARLRWAGAALARQLFRLGLGEEPALIAIATGIGLLAGLTILGFYRLLALAGAMAEFTAGQLTLPAAWVHFTVLCLGIGLARFLVRVGTQDSDGENVPAVMLAVARLGGRLPVRAILFKTLAAGLVIGSGGSVGAEGPVAVLGAGTASATGRWFRLGSGRLPLLVSCGAAAGISGAFGAPIAGLFFAVEKLFGGTRNASLAPLVVASVTAAAVTRSGLGPHAALLQMPGLHGGWSIRDLLLGAALGVVGGAMGALYSRTIWWGHDLLRPLSPPVRVVLAGALLAFLYSVAPASLLGVGPLRVEELATHGALFLAALALAKLAATSLTLGAAGVGGLFTPALVAGALTGAAAGRALELAGLVLPLGTAGYALVGMAALLAGSTHAPLTAIFIVLEMSGDWSLILPLLLAGALGHVTARRLHKESVYSEWFVRRGERLLHGADRNLLAELKVADAMDRAPVVLPADARLSDLLETLREKPRLEYPVVDGGGDLVGMLTLEDWHRLRLGPDGEGDRKVRDVARPAGPTVTDEDSLLTALRRMGSRDAPLLPVVEVGGRRVLGVIGRREVFAAYEAASN